VKAVHFRHGEPQHELVPLSRRPQHRRAFYLKRRRATGIQLDVGAALPAIQNIRRQEFGRNRAVPFQLATRKYDALLRGQHVFPPRMFL
jgi:hypothetical protein